MNNTHNVLYHLKQKHVFKPHAIHIVLMDGDNPSKFHYQLQLQGCIHHLV
jgi:hypothetical protein